MRTLLALMLVMVSVVAAAGETRTMGFVNAKVSSRSIAINQPVRVEFVSMPRQVEGVDIAATVLTALEVGRVAASWRLMGRPMVTEHEKTKTVTVSFAVLPRQVGELPLPAIPLRWLSGDQIAELGAVKVLPALQVGSENRPMPKEVVEVAGRAWASKFSAAEFKPDQLQQFKEAVVARPQTGLELIYRSGELAEAVLLAPGLDLTQARESFLNRWGAPQFDQGTERIAWVLGWTAITATPYAEAAANGAAARSGVRVHLVHEGIQAHLNESRVREQVFSVLDPASETLIGARPGNTDPLAPPAK